MMMIKNLKLKKERKKTIVLLKSMKESFVNDVPTLTNQSKKKPKVHPTIILSR